jgi:NADPH2:quinone reductase
MARAVVATAYGGPEVLSVVDVDLGPPQRGEVSVEVRAAGVNPADYKLYHGLFGKDPSKLPLRLGYEAAGVVREVGGPPLEGVDGPLAPGDEVIMYPISGAYATEVVVKATNAVHKPANLSFEEASGLLLTGATAVHALQTVGTQRGEALLVHGASGGVGLMVCQLALLEGARVIGTARPANHERLRALGVEPVSYGEGLLERLRELAPSGVDAAIDVAGTEEALLSSLALVRDRSRVVTAVASQRARDLGIKSIGSGPGAEAGTEVRAAARGRLAQLAGEGKLKVFLAGTYPLAQAGAAHEALASGKISGKLALVP